jgi:hypothetical protein
MEQFYTAAAAEEGVELPLYLPNGEKTEYFLRVRGIDSDKFRIADAQSKRGAVVIAAIDDDEKRTKALLDMRIKLAATLVIDWNLSEPCTLANVEKLFRNAPQLLEMVDRVASQRSLFFSRKQTNSASGLKQSSSSTKGRKNRAPASGTT